MNTPQPVTPAEVEARRRAAALGFRARLPNASPGVRAAAEMAEVAIRYGTLAGANPPRSIRTVHQVVADAVISGLSGTPAPERVTAAEREAHAAKVWGDIVRRLPVVGAREPARA